MLKKLLFIFLICSVSLVAQDNLKYPSLLWKISGNGLKNNGYLYGTMHVSNKVAFHLSDQFFEALRSADVVGLETNPSEWLANMEMTGELSKASGVGLYNPYGGNFYKSVYGMRFPDKQVYQSLLSFDPEIINGLLYRHSMSQENFEENTYIDLFIFQAASKLNKKVVSLEDFIQAEIQAKLAALPDSELNSEEPAKEDYQDSYGNRSNAVKIEDAYRNGNLDAIDSLTKLVESKNMQKYLLENRNVYFVHNIDSILRSGKTLFSGVGAAHLPGQTGLIEMLRRMNYKVEPIMPKQTKKAIKEQEAIDNIIKPIALGKVYSHDSLFSVQIPGKLTQIMNFDNIKYFINADMINGNFYNIARLKTNAVLNNYSVEKIALMMDSLFFENIPGKIISKRAIENNGFKGFDIVNKTRRGDLQRYQIFITDIEMILFKLGGKGEFVNSSLGKQFFNSIKFEQKVTNSTAFEPPAKGFKVNIPNEYSYSKNDYVGVSGLVEDLSAYNKNDNLFFGVKHAVFNDFYYLEQDSFELNRLYSYTLGNFKFTKEVNAEQKKEQGVPCVYFSAKNSNQKKFVGKIYIKGIHYYLVFMIGDDKINFTHPFFKSFELTDFKFLNEIKEITDKELAFKTKDETSNSPAGKFNEAFMKAYTHIKDSLKAKKTSPLEYDYITRTKNYYSPSSHEYIEIFYERYNDYDYRDKKELVQKINKNLGELLTMNVRPIKQTDEKGVFRYEFMLTDTATVRAVKVKVFAKSGVIYQVKVPYDTLLGLKGWASDFYNSFDLLDTAIGKDLFQSKFKTLLNDLSGADTAVKRRAEFSLSNSVSMEKVYLDDFLEFMQSNKLANVSSDAKAQLFVNGGVLENDKIIPVYKKLFEQYTDSAYLQICLLKGLAYYKTQNTYKTILELLLKETPLVGDESVVSNVFKVMQDSLELCAPLYPSLLSLTRNSEYHEPIYKLLSLIVKNNLLKPEKLMLSKDVILLDANSEFKRYNASLAGKGKAVNQYQNLINESGIEETIQLIKANLESLTNSQYVKDKRKQDILQASDQPLLLSFANILMPYYKTDQKVAQFIDKVAKVKTDQIAMPMFILLKKNSITLNDTLAAYYSKNIHSRAYFYNELEKEKLVHVFAKEQSNQKALVESMIKTYEKISSYNNYEPDKSKDSLIFFKLLDVKNKYEKGKLYVFKTPKNKLGICKWSVAFVPAIADTKLTTSITILKLNELYNETLTDDEVINELMDDFANNYRTRIVQSSGTAYSDY